MISASAGFSQTAVTRIQGALEIQHGPAAAWQPVRSTPSPVIGGDHLRTGPASLCELTFADGSKVVLQSKSDFTLGKADAGETSMEQKLGTLKAWVQKAQPREFKVKTPSVVCAVRGTEFLIKVGAGGDTSVSLYDGLLAVSDNAGTQMLLHSGQSVEATPRQMFQPQTLEQNRQSQNATQRSQAASEVGLEMSKDQVLDAAAKEIKLAVYQQGESLINIAGDRVRVEEYILRPTPESFKLVVLNQSAGQLNYFFYQGNFNTALPANLVPALNQMSGCVGAPCQYYETSYETGRSNTIDELNEIAENGHQVDVNNNGVPADTVTQYFNSALDQYVSIAGGTPFYQTLFDKYALYSDGVLKQGWIGNNIQSYTQVNQAPNVDPITGAPLAQSLIPPTVSSVFPDPTQVNQTVTQNFGDGTFIKYDNFIISNAGLVAPASAFANILTGTQFTQTLLNWNYEEVITASEFQGRSIDLVVAPKVLIQSGLIQ